MKLTGMGMDVGGHEVLLGFIGHIGATELVLILLLVLVLFGARKIPELAKGLGSGLREFKKAAREIESVGGVHADNGGAASSISAAATGAAVQDRPFSAAPISADTNETSSAENQ